MRDVSVSKSRCAVVVRRECVEKSRWGFRDLVGCVKLTQPFFSNFAFRGRGGKGNRERVSREWQKAKATGWKKGRWLAESA